MGAGPFLVVGPEKAGHIGPASKRLIGPENGLLSEV